nr:MAG TPA_asm: hypothetical protein [Caudoviricetes sp.]
MRLRAVAVLQSKNENGLFRCHRTTCEQVPSIVWNPFPGCIVLDTMQSSPISNLH